MEEHNEFCPNGGKKRYMSRSHALRVRQTLMRARRAKNLHVYQCPYCHDYHLTSHNHKVR